MALDATLPLTPSPLPCPAETALGSLSLLVRHWFTDRYEKPTPAQLLTWPAIAARQHLLLCAPTGSGKTLAAMLPILSEMLSHGSTGLRCLYISPLKAVGTDVRRTLRRCLAEIAELDIDTSPRLRVGVRTGDTSARLRRRMVDQPPDILVTTPESLAVLLTLPQWVAHFTGLQWVVIDEVHSFAGTKRGADLSLSLERLDDIAPAPLQRIGLSATCAPIHAVSQWLVGSNRRCVVARVNDANPLQIDIEPLPHRDTGFLACLVDRLADEINDGVDKTTLIFTNARGLAERLTWNLRRRFPQLAADIAVHHSSLAPARRRQVERRLKQGRLRVVVSSTSLELGIDVGSVDRVVLVHPPGSVVRLLQRLGRSGHRPGTLRSGLVLTANAGELLESVVTCASSHDAQLESLQIPCHPLDVLCQQLLGMAATRAWDPDEAFALVRRAYAYRELTRTDFDDCLAYLSGKDRNGEDWLPSRLHWQDGFFQLGGQRTAKILRCNLGTILTDESCAVRLEDGPLIGHLDEPFADRLQPGDRFLLDGRCLEYRRLTWEAIEVQEVPGRPAAPRWAGEGLPVAHDLARRLFLLRVQAAEALQDGPRALAALLMRDYGLDQHASAELVAYFVEQEQVSEIPDTNTLLIEMVPGEGMVEYAVHTPLHRAGNDGLARVAVLRLARDLGRSCTSQVANLGCVLCVEGRPLHADQWRRLLSAEDFDADLDLALADSLSLRERFQKVAMTALMVLRNPLGGRRKVGGPTWAERRLFDQVRAADPDFVLLRQAARELRTECCDAASALAFAELLPRMELRVRCLAEPSPFARHWSQATGGPGEAAEDALSRLHGEIHRRLVDVGVPASAG